MAETRRVTKEVAGFEYRDTANLRRLSKVAAQVEAVWSTQFDGPVKDTFISDYAPDTHESFGNGTDLCVGAYTSKKFRSMLAITTSLPPGAQVFSAHLSMTVESIAGTAPAFHIYRMTDLAWVESQATWNIKATGSAWTTPGAVGAYDSGTSVACAGGHTSGRYTFDVTPLVQAAVAAGQTTIGFILIADNETGSNYTWWCGRENASAASRPTVCIDYGTAANYDRLSTITAGTEIRAEIGGDADWRSSVTRRRLTGVSAQLEWRPAMFAYINGTVGGTDGTLVSMEGAGTLPIPFTDVALKNPVHVLLRCTNGFRSPGAVTITAPARFEVSVDGITWGTTCTLPAVGDTNVLLYVRQVNLIPNGEATLVLLNVDHGSMLLEEVA